MRMIYFTIYFYSLLAFPLQAALVLPPAPPKQVAIDWDGIDDYDGGDDLAFSGLGDTQQAFLRVLCNAEEGYSIWLHSDNANKPRNSFLKKENGSDKIRYKASMDVSGIRYANVQRANLNLKNADLVSIKVRFNKNNHILPMDGATQANVIALTFILDSYTGSLWAQGTYTDVITATIALN